MQNAFKNPFHPSVGALYHAVWNANTVEPNRRIYDFELVYVARGNLTVATQERSFLCSDRSAVIIPPGVLHYSVATSSVERWCVHFDWYSDCTGPRFAPDVYVFASSNRVFEHAKMAIVPEIPGVEFPFFQPNTGKNILPLLHALFLPGTGTVMEGMRKEGILLQILSEVFSPDAPAEPESILMSRLFFEAKNRIDTDFCRPDRQVAEIARALRITPNHLAKLFRRNLGISATDYIAGLRLKHAMELLAEPALSIREICFASGFEDPNYFSRFFRRRTGVSPREYRTR